MLVFSSPKSGFTLVEVAVGMIVIGLLLGGILQGMEIYRNSQINAIGTQLKEIDTAITTFKNTYNALPGDFRSPNRIPNCTTAPCNRAGNGNMIIETLPANGQLASIQSTVNMESTTVWAHLFAADLLGGYTLTNVDAEIAPGVSSPVSPLEFGYMLAWQGWNATLGNYNRPLDPQNYLGTYATFREGATICWLCVMNGREMNQLDTKFDDGTSISGRIRDTVRNCPEWNQSSLDCRTWNTQAGRFLGFYYAISAD
jgi:prepilin-type N-terminal cleavage/methylation domain-containing protein